MPAHNINKIVRFLAPCLNLKMRCDSKYKNRKSIGKAAGYTLKLRSHSPFINKMMPLCKPQPGQSICKSILLGHLSMCSSSH
jgi:hypothetical protein